MSRGLRLQDLAFLGRVGNAGVTPLSFPGLHRWYKADSYTGIANDGDSVGGGGATRGPWIDQTGSGDDGIGLGIFRANQVGTQPWIECAGTSFTFAPGVLNNFTIIVLVHTVGGNDSFSLYNQATGHQIRQQFFATHEITFYAGGAVVQSSNLGATGALEALEIKRSAGNITFRQNIVAKGTGIENTPWTVVTIGSSAGAGSVQDFAEILIYNTVISEANLDLLYNQYLKPKWVTLP